MVTASPLRPNRFINSSTPFSHSNSYSSANIGIKKNTPTAVPFSNRIIDSSEDFRTSQGYEVETAAGIFRVGLGGGIS
jgi:hypothetical protein